MSEKITIEDLAGMMKRGFDGVDERFNGVDKKFLGIDERFDEIDERFDGIDKRFDEVDKRFDQNTEQHQQIFKRLEKLERGQEDIQSLLGKVAFVFEVRPLDRRLKLVEEKLAMA